MSARLLDGKALAAQIRIELTEETSHFVKAHGRAPGLATVLVGDDPASHTYVGSKIKACQDVGMVSFHRPLPASATMAQLIETVHRLNQDPSVDGILVQLPLPGHADSTPVLDALDPTKDADGLHPLNLGLLFEYKSWADMAGGRSPLSCTPHGCVQVLQRSGIPVSGKRVVVLGRSKLVGKPVAMMLQALDATVTMAHSRTQHLEEVCREADILIAAIGKPKAVTASMVKPGAVVIDVGINRDENGKLCGDVDQASVEPVASALTPVPGGIGPMTVTMLLFNTLQLARRRVRQK